MVELDGNVGFRQRKNGYPFFGWSQCDQPGYFCRNKTQVWKERIDVKRRLISLFLSLVMLLTLLPVTALAEEEGSTAPKGVAAAQENTETDLAEREENEGKKDETAPGGGSSEEENNDPSAAEYQIDEIDFRHDVVIIGGPQDRTAREDSGYIYSLDYFKSNYLVSIFHNRGIFYGTLAAFEAESGISVSFESDQDDGHVWQNGEDHSFTAVLTKDDSQIYTQELNVRVFDNDVTNVSVSEPMLLVEGNDAYFDVEYNYETKKERCYYTQYRFNMDFVRQEEWVVTKQDGTSKAYTLEEMYNELGEETPFYAGGEYQTADTRWKAGEEHTLSVEFLGKIYSIPAKVVKPRYELVDFQYKGGTAALLEGVNIGWLGRYNLPDVAYEVTYTDGENEVTASMCREDIMTLFDNRVCLTYMSTQVYPDIHWQVGEDHYFYVNLLGKMTTVPVKIVSSCLGTLSLEEPDCSVVVPSYMTTLTKYELAGCSADAEWDVPRFVLTMQEGQTYNGQSQLTGTLAELAKQLDVDWDDSLTLEGIEDCENNISEWEIGKPYAVQLTFCGLPCEISIKRDGGPIDSIVWSSQNSEDMIVTLIEGYTAAACLNDQFAYNPLWRDKGALFEFTFNADGMKQFGLDQATYTWTLDQFYERTGLDVLTDNDGQFGNLAPDENGLSYFEFYPVKFEDDTHETRYETVRCKTPFKLVEYTGTPSVASVEYGDTEPLRLVKGADGDGEDNFIYSINGAMNTDRFRLKITLSDNTVFTGTPTEVGNFLYSEIGTYYYAVEDHANQIRQETQPWQIGSDGHTLRIYLCGLPCDIPVTLTEGMPQELTEEVFPDDNFRAYLQQEYGDDDGNVLFERVWTIECAGMGITSLKGIENFPNLIDLRCGGNNLTEIDLSSNPKVWTLWCENNPNLTTLTFAGDAAVAMSALKISNTKIGENGLDFSKMPELGSLVCVNSGFSKIDVSANLWLYELNCAKNSLTMLDVSKNTYLEDLDCSENQITSLTLPGQQTPQPQRAKLFSVLFALFSNESDDNVTPVEGTSAVVKLKSLDCSQNRLQELDAAVCTQLESLRCTDNGQDSSLQLNVATINDLALTAIGTKLSINAKDGSANNGFAFDGILPAALADIGTRLTLSRTEGEKEITYATGIKGKNFQFEVVTEGTYTLAITSDESDSLIPYILMGVKIQRDTPLNLPNITLSIRGDVNLDGVVDVYDLQRLYEHCSSIRELTGYAQTLSDVNEDGNIDSQSSILDMQKMYDLLTGGIKERPSKKQNNV